MARGSYVLLADKEMPKEMAAEWTELAYLQLKAGNAAIDVFALAVMFVFLVLAAQYESWSLPLAVILVVPMCLLCSVTGVIVAGFEVNIFTQIGFVVLVGLAVFSGMVGVTLFGIFLTPVFYYVVRRFSKGEPRRGLR